MWARAQECNCARVMSHCTVTLVKAFSLERSLKACVRAVPMQKPDQLPWIREVARYYPHKALS